MKLDKQYIDKPKSLEAKFSLIAMLGIRERPLTPDEVINTKGYTKSEIAFNPTTEKVQVFVTSANKKGLDNFKEDYPNAELRDDASIEDSKGWYVTAYPEENTPPDAVPLDNYFQGFGKNAKK